MKRNSARLQISGLALAIAIVCLSAHAATTFRGPVEATVVKVIDGDTFLADAAVWPGQTVRVNIRIRGIDAPEMKARCDSERIAALRARDALAELLASEPLAISNIAGAKYYGRVLADVSTIDGVQIASAMIDRQLVRSYAGGRRAGWCG